jgi:hypothetical protein
MTHNIETPPHDETIAQIARGLTKAQREALVSRPRHHDVWGNPDQYCVITRNGTVNALYGRRMIELGGNDLHFRLTDLGQEVRSYLENHP